MFSWFASKSVGRTPALLQDQNFIYDLTFLEWEQKETLLQSDKVYVCIDRNKNKENRKYELIFKKERLLIFSIYRDVNKENTVKVYDSSKAMLNLLSEGILTKKPIQISLILREIMKSIKAHPNWTSAHIAAKVGLDELFNKKPDHIVSNLNKQISPDLLTPLHLAIESDKVSVTKAVLALKPDLKLKDHRNYTPLHFAAMSDRDILLLIFKQKDIFPMLRIKDKNGCTPLHLSCFANKTDNVIEFLMFGLTLQMMTVSPPKKKHFECDDNKVIRLTKEDIDDLDTDDMRFGGTPLHWVKHRRSLEKFIAMGLRLDVINANSETALHTMVKRLRLKCMVGLLCYGVDVNAVDRLGNSSLHCAIKSADVTSSQALIVFDSDIDAKNRSKESPRHIAATGQHSDHNIVLYLLTAVGAKRCVNTMKNCKPGCAFDGKYEGKPYYKWPLYQSETLYKEVLMEPIIRATLETRDQTKGKNAKRVRMICLDGGGVRGLITIQVLLEIENRLGKSINDCFEWISGTSTGSILAMLLSTGRPLREGRTIYLRLKDKLFIGSRPYSSKVFEQILEEEIGSDVMMSDIMTKFHKKLIVNATLIDRTPAHLYLFRSYDSPEEILGLPESPEGFPTYPNCKEQIAWRACRASGAAPTYFRSSGAFLDGGIIANNPTLDALAEFKLYNNALKAVGRSDQTEDLDLVLSIGTGRFPLVKQEPIDVVRMWTINPREIQKNALYVKNMGNLLVNQVTNTEGHVIDRAQSWCSWIKTPYFRLNPPLSEVLSLDETSDVEICNALWETKAYMFAMRDRVDVIIQLLSSERESKTNISNASETESDNKKPKVGQSLEVLNNSINTEQNDIKVNNDSPTKVMN